MNEDADVNDVMSDEFGCVELSGVWWGLQELDDVALRVVDAEGFAAAVVMRDLGRNLPALVGQIQPQALGVVGVEADVVEAIHA